MQHQHIQTLLEKLRDSLQQQIFIKMTLSAYIGQEKDLKNLYIRRVYIKNQEMLSFLYRYKTKDITKNYEYEEALTLIESNIGTEFNNANLFTTTEDLLLACKDDRVKLKTMKPSSKNATSLEHNKQKNYLIDPSLPFLYEVGVTNAQGVVRSDMYDKFKQINKFIEIVDSLFTNSDLEKKETLTVVDLGAGKSYLTFAMYHYLHIMKGKNVKIIGVEMREDLVEKSNQAAQKVEYTGLSFIQSTISDFSQEEIDIVIALHACDTATDDTIMKGLQAKAELMIFSPCCHKYVRKQMNSPEELKDILKYGILEQRQSDIITDGLRAMTLEYHGYKTQVIEFISQEYTSKNLLLTAVKVQNEKNLQALENIKAVKKMFLIDNYYLDKELKLE